MQPTITETAKARRIYWVKEIHKLSGNFGDDSSKLEVELENEIERDGPYAIIDHLRLCGAIPEAYTHDSSEEKLYSKYTDAVLAQAFRVMGLTSAVLKERGDTADVEVFAKSYSFIADAKAFRLSRTAKNQKDFKIQAMDDWKRGKPHAMVVCPVYQLPATGSQIYQQASVREVCIFTYSHLAVLVLVALNEGPFHSEELLSEVFNLLPAMNPSKDAVSYWLAINKAILASSPKVTELWKTEKQASVEAIAFAKQESLTFLANEREKIMRMSHNEAVQELLRVHKIENRVKVISSISNNGILEMGIKS